MNSTHSEGGAKKAGMSTGRMALSPALSLPEMVLKLIAVFAAVVGIGILITGWLFNLLF